MTRSQANLVGAAILGGIYGGALGGLIALAVEKEWHYLSAWKLQLQGFHYAWGRMDRSAPLDYTAIGLVLLAGAVSGALLTPVIVVLAGMGQHVRLIPAFGEWGGLVLGTCAAVVLVLVLIGWNEKVWLACLGLPVTLGGAVIGWTRGWQLAVKVQESLERRIREPSP